MLNKIGLMLITASTTLPFVMLTSGMVQAEIYPQYVEIVKQSAAISSACQCSSVSPEQSNSSSNLSDQAILNSDQIGEKAIAKFGCDCAAHRRTIAQFLINQLLPSQ